jgi:peptidyl-tRNA hydrolase
LVSHVLGKISQDEQEIFNNVLNEIPDIVALLILGMGNQAMTKFNGRDFSLKEPVKRDKEEA